METGDRPIWLTQKERYYGGQISLQARSRPLPLSPSLFSYFLHFIHLVLYTYPGQ